MIGPSVVQSLKLNFGIVINYNLDDPFGDRDKRTWHRYLKSVQYYDLIVVVREVNIAEAYTHGAKRVLRVFRSADEIAHSPQAIDRQEQVKWDSKVLFAGTWMPERGNFLSELITQGVPLSIYGDRWQKAKEWSILKAAWKGHSLYGAEYIKAIQCSKICLGLLSKGNRDLHTQRSMEIPYIGSVLCAERTSEHIKLYREGLEAVFWMSPQECVLACKRLLNDNNWRQKIADDGKERCIKNGYLNENVMKRIINEISTISKRRV